MIGERGPCHAARLFAQATPARLRWARDVLWASHAQCSLKRATAAGPNISGGPARGLPPTTASYFLAGTGSIDFSKKTVCGTVTFRSFLGIM
jgi:hypothetical protein